MGNGLRLRQLVKGRLDNSRPAPRALPRHDMMNPKSKDVRDPFTKNYVIFLPAPPRASSDGPRPDCFRAQKIKKDRSVCQKKKKKKRPPRFQKKKKKKKKKKYLR